MSAGKRAELPSMLLDRRAKSGLKTYSHLAGRRRIPSEYEVATTRLLYCAGRGFEVNVPLSDWYAKYQAASPLFCADWDRFGDPAETTYTKYVAVRRQRELHVEGILRAIDETDYDGRLSPEWIAVLRRVLPPLRFPLHGLQLVASYVGSMAPGGRLAIVHLLQAADEMRRIQRITYRSVQLSQAHPGFGDDARTLWERDAGWQPLREVTEKLLVTYDFGESLVGLNLCLKPALDVLFMRELGAEAIRRGDSLLSGLLVSFSEDCHWHREWTKVLFELLVSERAENAVVVRNWVDRWMPRVEAALRPLTGMVAKSDNGGVAIIEEITSGLPDLVKSARSCP